MRVGIRFLIVVAGAIPLASNTANGLMSKYRALNNYIDNEETCIKIILNKSVALNMLISSIKTHEIKGPAIGFLYGYSEEIMYKPIVEGRYLNSIKIVVSETESIIYIIAPAYVYVSIDTFILRSKNSVNIKSINMVNVIDIPSNAMNIYEYQ